MGILREMAKLQKTVLTGSPFERGVTHGDTYSNEIANNVDVYDEVFADRGVSPDEARSLATTAISIIEDQNPKFAEAMRGVAEGSELPLEEIAMVNVRHTIIYSAMSDGFDSDEANESGLADGCTSFGVQPERTANNHTYLGQNWDWMNSIELFLMEVHQEDGPNFIALTEAGMISGKFGFNENGIGFVVNGLSTPEDGKHPTRKPSHVRGREIFDAERFDQALAPIVSSARPTSRNYMVAHENGELIDIETTPDSFDFIYPNNNFITHANHFEKRIGIDSQLEKKNPHSIVRGMRARRLFNNADGDIGVEFIQSVLRDDFGKPASITRHPDLDEDEHASQTNASVIMDLTDKVMYATYGPPDKADYHTYHLSET